MKAPDFWREDGLLPTLLSPLSLGLRAGAAFRRLTARHYDAPVPVICVGNLIAGGAGKTPVAIALGARLATHGKTVHFLSRGYGGRETGPLRVDPARHTARDVGDEPLLLAATAPSWIARDRGAGAKAAAEAGAQVIVMDDGFQNPGIGKDLSIVVVDGGYGFGNRRVMPAGPLREPLAAGLDRADAVVLMEPDTIGVAKTLPTRLPLLRATLAPGRTGGLSDRPVFAFAGIARPEKFFATLEDLGAIVAGRQAFADHHAYSDADIAALLAAAENCGAVPVTTEKDAIRLPASVREKVEVLPVSLRWQDDKTVESLLAPYF
jgi:tetraacyldisaccharide 4'-kinase